MSDFYVSAWVKLDDDAFDLKNGVSKIAVVRCQKTPSVFGFDIGMIRNKDSGDFAARASVQTSILATQIERIQNVFDLTGWTHLAMYIDSTRNLRLSVNSVLNS